MPDESKPKLHQRITGLVVSHKSKDTAVVKVTRRKVHPKYKKYYTSTKKLVAHDPAGLCKEGDMVEIIPSRPISKTKRFIVSKKI